MGVVELSGGERVAADRLDVPAAGSIPVAPTIPT